jgi:hypothetical protein
LARPRALAKAEVAVREVPEPRGFLERAEALASDKPRQGSAGQSVRHQPVKREHFGFAG